MECNKCGGKLEMYYKLWCPKCEKPQIVMEPTLNFIQALQHLESIGHTGIKDRLWSFLGKCFNFSNDSYVILVFPGEEEEDEYEPQELEDLRVFKETFNLTESILLDISW